ncbi:MAG TPA: prepilin-type N-terminal cleavage/methylation domain-containing protein [Tepidisphaeraceae bacterium]|nr:prepilin-type N-terminal cleavage/methylation domain-containing protein [Tepidisphaeraceae bacterium]
MPTFRHSGNRGFTLTELMMGMLVTSLVLAALAAFVDAVAVGWEASDGTQDAALEAHQAYQRLDHYLSSALYVAQPMVGSTSTAIFFWANDNWNSGGVNAGDECPEFGEMNLIEYDSSTNTIWLYQPISGSAMSANQFSNACARQTYADIISSGAIALFLSQNFCSQIPLAHDVTSATFDVVGTDSTTQRPIVEMNLIFQKDSQTITQYGTVTLRAPSTRPSP